MENMLTFGGIHGCHSHRPTGQFPCGALVVSTVLATPWTSRGAGTRSFFSATSSRQLYMRYCKSSPRPRGLRMSSPGGKALWGCPAPPKVRIFAWRLASNTLATRENKVKHHIEKSDICLLCGVECEDTFRTFTTCSLARGIWKAMGEEWCMPRLENVVNTGTDWCCTSWILVVKRSGYQS